jgi:hypothetical protein
LILDTTYKAKENKRIINDLIGKPYNIIESIKLKGIGSKRMIIEDVSPNLYQYINSTATLNYANIEIRSAGIIIYINKGLKNYSWIIPFYHLVIYKTNGLSIHAQGNYIHFKNNITFKENKSFFNKLLNEKVKHDLKYDFYN